MNPHATGVAFSFPDDEGQPLVGHSLPISIGQGYGTNGSVNSIPAFEDFGDYTFSPGTSYTNVPEDHSQSPPHTPTAAAGGSSKKKKPTRSTPSSKTPSRREYIPPHGSSMHHRMRLYQRLNSRGLLPDPTPPSHVVPAGLFFLGLPGKHGTVVTMYSILTTVVGAAFLVIPWGFSEAGLIGGVLAVVLLGFICTYTGTLVAQHSSYHNDWLEVCLVYLGKSGYHVCWISSIGVLLGALMAYFCIMDACLQSIVRAVGILASTPMNPSYYWVPLLAMALFLLSIINLKSLNGLMRFNSFAVVSVLWFIVVATYKSVEHIGGNWQGALANVKLFGPHPQYACGMILMSYFIHNVAIEIFHHHSVPEKNDVAIAGAFSQAALGYIAVGFLGYLAFGDGILQNFIMEFQDTDLIVLSARIALMLQLFTVFPLISFVIRVQLFGVVLDQAYPGPWIVLLLNVVLIGICVVIAIFIPEVGTVLRYTGAVFGLAHIFVLPIFTDYVKRRREGRVQMGVIVLQMLILTVGVMLLVVQFVPVTFSIE